jgi:dipeptidyl-peptidase-4
VPIARRFEIYADRTDVIEQRYPAAGDPNVLVELKIVSPVSGEIRNVDLGANKDIWCAPTGAANSKARCSSARAATRRRWNWCRSMPPRWRKVLVTETAKTWVSIFDDLRFLSDNKGFIWSSERSGRKHLYLYDMNGKLLHADLEGRMGHRATAGRG